MKYRFAVLVTLAAAFAVSALYVYGHGEAARLLASGTGFAILAYATVGYIRGILDGIIKPHRLGWTIWTLATLTGLVGTALGHAGLPGLVVPFSYLLLEAIVTILAWSNKYGWTYKDGRREKGWEWLVFVPALPLAIGWHFFVYLHWINLPIGIWLAIVGDAMAAFFTLRKEIEDPASEEWKPWAFSCAASAFGIASLDAFHFTALGFPAYLVLQTGLTTALILYMKNKSIRTVDVELVHTK